MSRCHDEIAWAAAWGMPRDTFINVNSVRSRRQDVQMHIGDAWKHPGENWRQGWKRAYREGCRIIRVRVSVYNKETGDERS